MAEEVDDMRVGASMEISALANDEVVRASGSISVREAATIMDREGIGLLVLEHEGGGTGVMSERDVLRAVASGADLDATASSVGNGHSIQRAVPTSTVRDVANEMMQNYVRHVLITDPDGDITGVVSVRDLLAIIVD